MLIIGEELMSSKLTSAPRSAAILPMKTLFRAEEALFRNLTSASSDVIPLVRSQSARKQMTNHIRGAPPGLRQFRNTCKARGRYPRCGGL